MKKIYIGAKFENADKVISLSKKLEEHNIINEYNWAINIKDNETKEEMIASAIQEMKTINEVEYIIFLLPLGRGSNIELGIALANNKKIILCSNNKEDFENNTVNFYEMNNIAKIVGDDDEIYHQILSEIEKNNLEEEKSKKIYKL